MKILKKIFFVILCNIDKLILLLVLIFLVMSVLDFMNSSKVNAKKRENLEVKTVFTPYQPVNENAFNSKAFLGQSVLWEKSGKRNSDKKSIDYISAYTDFMKPFKIARSIAEGANDQLIPYDNYLLGVCPITNMPLPIPNSEQLSLYTSNYDYDQDGIPDVIEKKLGLNPEDPADALYDSDNDSFPNIIEYKLNKEEGVLSADIHPALIKRFILERIANTSIPVLVKSIIKSSYNKNKWTIQLNIHEQKGWKTKFLRIGDSFKVNDIEYTVSDIDESFEPVLNPRLGVVEEVDSSIVIFEDNLGQEIEAVLGKPVYEPNRRIILKDLYTGKTITTKINNEITIGDENTGKETYKILSIGMNDKTVVVENIKTLKQFTLSNRTDYRKPLNK